MTDTHALYRFYDPCARCIDGDHDRHDRHGNVCSCSCGCLSPNPYDDDESPSGAGRVTSCQACAVVIVDGVAVAYYCQTPAGARHTMHTSSGGDRVAVAWTNDTERTSA